MATSRSRHHQHTGGKGFRADLVKGWRRIYHRSGARQRYFLLMVMTLGTLLRILRMGAPITYDEALTYTEYASAPFAFLFSDYTFLSNHILLSALVKASILLFGTHLWSLRLPAFIAGVLVMPVGYAFAHRVFNRHIATIFLCFLAVSGPLVEYSAMARGYSLVWLFTLCALLAARHFVRAENMVSLAAMALTCALGMWATPTMAYPAIMVYIWALGLVLIKYKSTVRRRVVKLSGSLILAMALVLLFYTPVVSNHGMDQLLHHPALVGHTWKHFLETQQDRTFDVWAYFTDTTSYPISLAAMAAIFYAAYISVKYRLLIFGLGVGIFPLVLLQQMVAAPAVWTFTLLIFHLGLAIGLFYLLKTVRDKLLPKFAKSQRTLVGSLLVLGVVGWLGLMGQGDRVERFPEADQAAEWLKQHAGAHDRICVHTPWDAPVAFYMARRKMDARAIEGTDRNVQRLLVLVAPSHGQTVEGVVSSAGLHPRSGSKPEYIHEWGRLELFGLK